MTLLARALAALALSATAAFSGPQYTDTAGYALSGYDTVSYFDLDQQPIGADRPAPLPGKADYTTTFNGAQFAFASAENLARFLENPAAFVPQYDGHCAYAVAKGSKAPANPLLWRIVDGKLYVNFSARASSQWEGDIPGNLTLSEANWPRLEPTAASTGTPPRFTPNTP
jgi:YHS domain-containing protein